MVNKIQESYQHYIRVYLYPNIVRDLLLSVVLSFGFLLNFDTLHLSRKHIHYASAEKYQKLQEQLDSHIQKNNPFLNTRERKKLVETILLKANAIQLSPSIEIEGRPVQAVYFLTAMIQIESGFNSQALSPVGARGYMQIMPRTSKWIDRVQKTSIDLDHLYDTKINITRGIDYLNYLLRKLKDIRLVCLAYNAGEGNLKRGVWVESYWSRIANVYEELRKDAATVAQADTKRL